MQDKQGSLIQRLDVLDLENEELRNQIIELEEQKEQLEEKVEALKDNKRQLKHQLEEEKVNSSGFQNWWLCENFLLKC